MPPRRAAIERKAPAWLVATLIASAIAFGGGGSPSPAAELLLQLVFVLIALGWVWTRGRQDAEGNGREPMVTLLIFLPLAIPLLQLIPLPPAIWSALPGRESLSASLALIGEQHSWRPLSLSPPRTIASLLAIVPAVFCLYATSRLDLSERRLAVFAIVGMTLLSLLLGILQLASGHVSLSLYANSHTGWVTGFQANRNSTADVLLIGLVGLSVLAAPRLAGKPGRGPDRAGRQRTSRLIIGGLALLILFAAVMTGSRAGIALIPCALAAAGLIYFLALGTGATRKWRAVLAGLGVASAAALPVLILLTLSQQTALSRVGSRFGAISSDARPQIWQDSWYAMQTYWPAGFGVGGFEPAMLAAERLEFLDPSRPNRAHNDFLEFVLESGAAGIVALLATAAVILTLAVRAWRNVPEMRPHVVFSLTCLTVIALHSIVDYPLRSMSLACLAGFAAGSLAIPPGMRDKVMAGVGPGNIWGRA